MWELDHKEGWELKNWCFQTVVLEKTPESLLYCKEIQTVNPIGNKPRIFIGRIDTEAEAPILWSPDVGKDWGQEEKGATEYEMVGWYHWLNGHEFAQTQGDSEGQGSLSFREGKPGVLQFMGSQRVVHDLATEQQQQLSWQGTCGWRKQFSSPLH